MNRARREPTAAGARGAASAALLQRRLARRIPVGLWA